MSEKYAIIKKYDSGIVPGLICERKQDSKYRYYLVFVGPDNKIKWWIRPNAFTQFRLYHANKWGRPGQHSQGIVGKPHELINYIIQHEAYELGIAVGNNPDVARNILRMHYQNNDQP